jgi:hypothetical protein
MWIVLVRNRSGVSRGKQSEFHCIGLASLTLNRSIGDEPLVDGGHPLGAARQADARADISPA